jgi:hypothetical protein
VRKAKGAVLARHESDFHASAKETLSLDELLDLLGSTTEHGPSSREDAIARYLSGDEGWREAVKLLGGTFAKGGTELRDRKAD